MSTLPRITTGVHSTPPDAWPDVMIEDAAWFAAVLADEEAAGDPPAGGDDDRDWFRALASDARRYAATSDAHGVMALAADVADDLVADFRRLGVFTAAGWLAHPRTRYTMAQADALATPTAWRFGSSLAEGIDSLASYHVGEGSVADRLFALLVLERGRDAEEFGALDYHALLSAEADEMAEMAGENDHLRN